MDYSAVRHRGLITVSIMLATIMQALDTTIANVALPHMQGSLSAAQDQIAWVLTSYIVAAAIITPLTGWLAARFGRKRVFLISVAGFTVASMACGAATSLAQIVLFRLLQGVAGAALVPLSQAVLLDINPREKHGQAMAIWGAGIMVGPILGPTLGGWLTDNYNWRWVFYINLPVGILAFLGILAFVSETPANRKQPFDLFGFTFLSLAVGSLQMMLDRGEQKDWFGSQEIVIEAALGLIGLWVFAVHCATSKRPFLNPALLRDRNFVTSVIFMFIAGAVMYSTLALLPPMLTMLNYPVVTTGILMSPRGVTTMICMMIVGRLIGRVDIRLILSFGFLVTGLSMWQMTRYSPEMDMWPVIIAGLTQGAGLGFVFVPLSTVAFATLPTELRTEGSGIFSLLRNIGGSIGISVVEAMLDRNIQINHSELVQGINPYNPVLQAPALHSYWSLDSLHGLAMLDQLVNGQAAMIAYVDNFKLMMIVCFAALPLLLLMRPARRKQTEAEAEAATAAAIE
ncbi:MAG TPA: DHA2 family efflux MFS transporter permease subunit [Stellaceae bacterium]|nr:DHA2 family efflux MFS transporter permease subunit [Stellaceae bacterium]